MTNTTASIPSLPNLGLYNRCSGSLTVVVPQESVNMLISPSFELYTNTTLTQLTCWKVVTNSGTSNADGWIVTGDKAWSGASSFYSGNVSAQTFQTLRYETLTVRAGDQYAWSFYVRGATSSKNRAYTTTIRDSSTNVVYASKSFSVVEAQWQRVELVFYNTSATSVIITIEKSTLSASYVGGDCYIDACQFESIVPNDTAIGDVLAIGATTYFDGSINGFYNLTSTKPEYAWRGFPHRSTSYRSNITTHGGREYNLQEDCGFDVIAINEGNYNKPNNQTVDFNTADGSALIDIVNPSRVITIVGRISGSDKSDFAMKTSRITALFSRDLSALRLPRRYQFQHKDDRNDVGVPMTFYAIFEGGLNMQVSSSMTADIEISLRMIDPYFYGHDESADLTKKLVYETNKYGLLQIPADVRDMYDEAYSSNWVIQPLGATKSAIIAGGTSQVFVLKLNPFDGKLWIGGSFTSFGGVSCNNIVTYDLNSKTFTAVLTGATNGVNGSVYTMDIAPNGDVWVGGTFTSAGGIANTAYCAYYRTNTFVGFVGAFNGTVYSVRVRPLPQGMGGYPYKVLVGGTFTTYAGSAMNRIAASHDTINNTFQALAVGTGVGLNNEVRSIAYNPVNDAFYAGGAFTGSGTGAYVALYLIEYVFTSANATNLSGYGVDARVENVFVDNDGVVIINGVFANIIDPSAGSTATGTPVIYTNQILKSLPNGPYTGGTPGPELCVMRNGVSSMAVGNTNGLSYWNGTARSGTNSVPIAKLQSYTTSLELPDGSIIVAVNGGSNLLTSQLTRAINSSTAAAKPRFIFYNGTDAGVQLITNFSNQKLMAFRDIFPYNSASVTPNVTAFQKYDVVTIDTKTVTAKSYLFGNISESVSASSQFTTFTVEPGEVILTAYDYSQTRTNSGLSPVDIALCVWQQTFQSIFDGVNKS